MQCKIQNAHKRLLESHRLWHQSLDNYFDPEGFRVNLNATIQALRNLTFALQFEKSVFNNFDSWYCVWQDIMKNDPILKWLNSARVEIVHQKDLEKKSIARVTVLGYYEIFKGDINFPIDIPDYMVAFYLFEKGYVDKEIIQRDYALKVERRWVLESLPDHEVLDALAYCYGFMYRLLREAHEILGTSIDTCSVNDALHIKSEILYNNIGIPNCMELTNKVRIKNLSLKTLEYKDIDEIEVKIDEDMARKAMKRYKMKEASLEFFSKK